MPPCVTLRRLVRRASLLAALAVAGLAPATPVGADGAVAAVPTDQPPPRDLPPPAVKPPAPAAATVCGGQRFIGQRVACYSDRAVQQGDPTVCFRTPAPDVRWPCVAKYAVVAGDAATCRLLPGPPATGVPATELPGGDAAVTVDLCLSTLALVYRRPDLCRQLDTTPMDDACLTKLVANGADPALCAQVKSPDLREVCRPNPAREVLE